MSKAQAIKALAEKLGLVARDVEPLYDAGYRTLAYRAAGDTDPYIRMNANIGAHSDIVGGAQAEQRLRDIRRHARGEVRPQVSPLMARAQRPLLMTDSEINSPLMIASLLRDRGLRDYLNRIGGKFPDREINAGTPFAVPLTSVAGRHAAERALRARGYDSIVYPNLVEVPDYVDQSMLREMTELPGGSPPISPVFKTLASREDFARGLLENLGPVPDPSNALVKWFNPSLSVLDYSAYRKPSGALARARDYVTRGYSRGGRAC